MDKINKVGEVLEGLENNQIKEQDLLAPKKEKFKFIKTILGYVIFLYIVMNFFVSAYRIPTGSMERTLRIGDMLLVNKFIYGFTTPDWFGIPYTNFGFDLPSYKTSFFKDVKQGDILVFKHYQPEDDQWVNYVKRCVALPGQTVEIKNKVLFVDGKKFDDFYNTLEIDSAYAEGKPQSWFFTKDNYPKTDNYFFRKLVTDLMNAELFYLDQKLLFLNPRKLEKPLSENYKNAHIYDYFEQTYGMCFADQRPNFYKTETKEKLLARKTRIGSPEKITIDSLSESELYKHLNFRDNFGPITVPANNYFMVGDNRDQSFDSRYWGFVNKQLIIGKPIMVYFSLDENIPWSKFFDKVRWERIGYLIQ